MKNVAVINDLSGIGRCSLTVSISILSVLKIQPCPLPTAILSNQTGFERYTFLDFTPYMKEYSNTWKQLGRTFDGIYSGFLGSIQQMECVAEFIKEFKNPNTLVIIDPVMGDNGNIYPIYPNDYPLHMKKLIRYADIITPNFTEFTLLTDYDFSRNGININEIKECAKCLGPNQVVITGVRSTENPNYLYNLSMDFKRDEFNITEINYNRISYSGTGDIFASILCGYLTHGKKLEEAVTIASEFISKAIAHTEHHQLETTEGILYELFLKELII